MSQLLRSFQLLLVLTGLVLTGLPSIASAEVPLPVIPEANARYSATQGCVEPTEEMREHHMEYLLHQRDETLREGIRTKKYSLKECINCHVPPPESGKVVHVTDKEHFCNACHSYAAVTIDCFSCHRDTPMPKTSGFQPLGDALGKHHATTLNKASMATETLETLVEKQ